MEATIKIGKSGVDKIVEETKLQLKVRKEIKIKVNRPMVEGRMSVFTKEIAEDLAKKTDSKILWIKGRTFILRRD